MDIERIESSTQKYHRLRRAIASFPKREGYSNKNAYRELRDAFLAYAIDEMSKRSDTAPLWKQDLRSFGMTDEEDINFLLADCFADALRAILKLQQTLNPIVDDRIRAVQDGVQVPMQTIGEFRSE